MRVALSVSNFPFRSKPFGAKDGFIPNSSLFPCRSVVSFPKQPRSEFKTVSKESVLDVQRNTL